MWVDRRFRVSPEIFGFGTSPGSGWANDSLSHARAVPGSLSGWKVKLQPSLGSCDLDQVFTVDLCTLPGSAAIKHLRSTRLPPLHVVMLPHATTSTCWDGIWQVTSGARFPPDMTFLIKAKQFNQGLIRPENLVSPKC